MAMLQSREQDSPFSESENYRSPFWENKVRSMLQVQLLIVATPRHLPRQKRDVWQLAWLQAHAISFANWLRAKPGRLVRHARRIHRGETYLEEELLAMVREIEKPKYA